MFSHKHGINPPSLVLLPPSSFLREPQPECPMENKETATSSPLGICEKLFNALHLNPTLRSLRRISYQPREPDAAAAAPPPPPVSNSARKDPAPLNKPSGPEHPVGAAGHRWSEVSVEAPAPRPPTVEPERSTAKNPTSVQPRTPQPSPFPAERGEPPSIPSKTQVPAPTPAPAPEGVASKLEDGRASTDNEKPAAEAGHARTAKKDLNQKVDEYISRTRARMRTRSGAGSSSFKGTRG